MLRRTFAGVLTDSARRSSFATIAVLLIDLILLSCGLLREAKAEVQQFSVNATSSREAQSWLAAGNRAQAESDISGAIEDYEKALAAFRTLRDRSGERITLVKLGDTYRAVGQYAKAITFYEPALAIARELHDSVAEARTLNNIGFVHRAMSQYGEAIGYYEQALAIERGVTDRDGEAATLSNLGLVYRSLSQYAKAISFYERALKLERDAHDGAGEGATLNNLGYAYDSLNEHDKAIGLYKQALQITHDAHDPAGEGIILNNLGGAYHSKNEYARAIGFYNEALVIARKTGHRRSEGAILSNLGGAYRAMRQYTKAIAFYQRSVGIRREVNDRAGEATTLSGLMETLASQQKPRLAILFGKQAVNTYQQIRQGVVSLDRDTRDTYVRSHEDVYRRLADLLLAQDRIAEAQQVLNLLKEEEFLEFVRGDSNHATRPARADLTDTEAEWQRRYNEIADRLTILGHERGKLLVRRIRTADQEKRLASLEQDLTIAGEAFQKFLIDLDTEASARKLSKERLDQVRDSEALMETLRQIGSNTVAVYTLVTEDKIRLIVITPDVMKTAERLIPRVALNEMVVAFRAQLQNRNSDPHESGKKLYGLILDPIAKDLVGAKAETILWSLDGALRYLPIAALYDGERYMIERFQNTVFTPASNANLKDVPARQWRALGLGVSEAHDEFDPLPGAQKELEGIIRDETLATTGVLPGVIKLNAAFTRETMIAALRQRYSVVHIASHFEFKAGNEADSFLLLGDGTHLSLADMGKMENPFGGVELLTLSACDTATGGMANGKEIEGFGVQAQRKGAKAVIATLWRVADVSTNELMQMFYRTRETMPEITKARALREAQLALLHGNDYRHPYYWAPFVLIGNSR